MAKKQEIKVNELVISVLDNEYISLTDLARFRSERPADTISNWMRNLPTIKFLGLWEQLNNPDFKVVGTDHFKGYTEIEQEYLSKVAMALYSILPSGFSIPTPMVFW